MADVHAVLTELGKDLAGNAGAVRHLPADRRDDRDVLRHRYLIRLHLFLQLAQHGVEAFGDLFALHHQRDDVDAGGDILHH